AYTSIKTALVGLTRSVAYDYGPHNIRANIICAGAIKTRISPEPGSELHQRQISKTSLGRIGQPRAVATAALFLASHESSCLTPRSGQYLASSTPDVPTSSFPRKSGTYERAP